MVRLISTTSPTLTSMLFGLLISERGPYIYTCIYGYKYKFIFHKCHVEYVKDMV